MGKFGPVFMAFLCNACGLQVFRTPEEVDCFPYISYLIVLYSMFALLWDIRVYSASFRKLYVWCDFLLDFVVEMFIIETIMNDFWIPFERSFVAFFPALADILTNQMEVYDFKYDILDELCSLLRSQGMLYAASYGLSIFYLLCIIHATRIVDFRILKCDGPQQFYCDCKKRAKRFGKKMIRNMKPSAKTLCFAHGTKEGESGCDSDDDRCDNCGLALKFHNY